MLIRKVLKQAEKYDDLTGARDLEVLLPVLRLRQINLLLIEVATMVA